MIHKGSLSKKTITDKNEQFSLKGMINPSFQNAGTDIAYVDGREIPAGETFGVDCPLVELQNSISVDFKREVGKTQIIYVHYVELVTNPCE